MSLSLHFRERERERRALQDRKFGKKRSVIGLMFKAHRDTNGIKRRENQQQTPLNDKSREGRGKRERQHDVHTKRIEKPVEMEK